eukprot:2228946-Prymnesium_polylepis.1
MSGRGRGGGRGRGIPISYPDGWAPKATPDNAVAAKDIPDALSATAADKELLTYQRRLRQNAAFTAFRVGDAAPSGDVARYSDRYRKVSRGAFAESEYFGLRVG